MTTLPAGEDSSPTGIQVVATLVPPSSRIDQLWKKIWRTAQRGRFGLLACPPGVLPFSQPLVAQLASALHRFGRRMGGRADSVLVCAPTTWTILPKDGSNLLGSRFNVLPARQMALITSSMGWSGAFGSMAKSSRRTPFQISCATGSSASATKDISTPTEPSIGE